MGPSRPVILSEVALPAGLTLLVLAPHPDDFDAVAVTLRRFQQAGARLHVAVLTRGVDGVENAFVAEDPAPAHKAAVREAEQCESCRRFGLPATALQFLRLDAIATGRLQTCPATARAVCELLRSLQPDVIVTPHPNDTNADHRATGELLDRITPQLGWHGTVLLNQDPKTVGLRTDLLTPFDEAAAQWKAELLRCHVSQHQRNLRTRGHGFDTRILQVNRTLATQWHLPLPYAEAFEVHEAAGAAAGNPEGGDR